jgi:hypothetical protein
LLVNNQPHRSVPSAQAGRVKFSQPWAKLLPQAVPTKLLFPPTFFCQ